MNQGEVRVLLIEDDRATAMVLEHKLAAVTTVRCRLTLAATLAEARARLARERFDLVIADLHLPDSPGTSTIEALVRECASPVIALTGDEDPALHERAMASGAYDFLLKGQLSSGALERLVRLAALQSRTFHSLRASETRLKAIVDAEPECVKLLDAEGRLIDMNLAGLRMVEADDLEVLRGKCVFDLVRPEQRETFRILTERVIHGGESSLEFEITGLKGRRLWLQTHAVPLRDEASGKTLVLAISRDMTEKKRFEDALRESESRFRSLVALSSDFYWETDAEHRVTVTTHGQKYSPASQPQVGKRRWDLPSTHPDAAGWAAHRADLDARRLFRDFEIGRIDPHGEQRFLAISGEPLLGPRGEFFGYRGVGSDISERKRDERLVALEHAVGRTVADATSATEGLREVMRQICASERWECGRYFAVDEPAGLLRFEHAWCEASGPMQAFVAGSRGLTYRRGAGLAGRVWESGEPLWIADVTGDARVAEVTLARAAGVHGALVFPVAFAGHAVGVIAFSSSTVREPDARLLGAMRAIGGQVAQFLQRKQAEQAVVESEEKFRRTFELAASGIAQVSLDGRFLDVNPRLCEMLGYSEGELIGRSVKEVSHPDDRDVTDPQRGLMRAGDVDNVRFEKRYLRKDGTAVWINLTVALARNAQGEPQHEIAVLEDISAQKEREAALQRFRTALDSSADMVFLFNLEDGRLLDFNHSACAHLGYSREELMVRGEEIGRLIASEDSATTMITEYRRKDGSSFSAESRRYVVDTPQGRVLVLNSRDLTERRSAERRRAAQARYQKKIARLGQWALSKTNSGEFTLKAVQGVAEGLGSAVAVAYVERAGEREVVLRRAAGEEQAVAEAHAALPSEGPLAQVLGRSEQVVAGAPWSQTPLPFAWAARYSSVSMVPVPGGVGARGALCALSEQAGVFGPEETRFLGAAASLLSAALHRFDSEERLAYMAQYDGLTGLPNRALLSDRFAQMTAQARRHSTVLGVLFIDLDEFKVVNDTQGHAAGDELLKEVARRLRGAVRPGDTVARISGDEFAVVLVDLVRPDDAALVAQKILERLAAPVSIAGQESFVTASIGISTFPADGKDAEALLGAADAAMYRAKQAGRNAFQFFTIEINQRTRVRAQLGVELRRALERKEFALVYQPKIDLVTGRPRGMEALLRWEHPERGTVQPAEFIPVLEETGLIVPVGEWALRTACEDMKKWRRLGLPAIPVAVNLSARQFRQQDLDARIRQIVTSAGVDPALIELEITESQLMHDPEHAVRVLRSLSSAGLRIAVDDFGTGYSSLAYLTRFPLTSLKIDKSFVADVLSDEADATIVRTVIDMAHTLRFTVVAEGVETQPQAALLRSLGCEQAQGFLFGRPMPAAEVARFMAAPKAAAPAGRRRAARRS